MIDLIKRFMPIRIHHTYFSYGWWWGQRCYFFNTSLSVVPISFLIGNVIFANNGKIIQHGYIDSWNRYHEQF